MKPVQNQYDTLHCSHAQDCYIGGEYALICDDAVWKESARSAHMVTMSIYCNRYQMFHHELRERGIR